MSCDNKYKYTLSERPVRLDELLSIKFEPARWLIQDLVPLDGITMLSGLSNTYKTWIMLDMALSIASDTVYLGQYDVKKVGVLIVDEESGHRLLQERLKSMGASSELNIHIFSRKDFKVSKENINSLIAYCLENDIRLVAIDSLVRVIVGDENSAKDMSANFNLLRKLVDEGISVLLLHHERKGSVSIKRNASSDIRGSSDILSSLDSHMGISNEKSHIVKIEPTKNRHQDVNKPFEIKFNSSSELYGFEWLGEPQTKDDRKNDIKNTIEMALAEHTGMNKQETVRKLQDSGCEFGQNAILGAIDELIADEVIIAKKGLTNNAKNLFLNEKTNNKGDC